MEKTSIEKEDKSRLIYNLLFLVAIIFLLYLSGLYNYLLFHTLVELFAVVVGLFIFIITWNTRKNVDAGYLIIIGIGYVFISILDFIHTLAYKGMPIFSGYGTNLPTQLWIAARYMGAFTLFIIPLSRNKIQKYSWIILSYACVFLALVLLIFYRLFPECYNEATGLTLFKRISEYGICAILFITLLILSFDRHWIDPFMFKFLVFSIIVTIVSELFFSIYVDVYGIFSFLGHICKFVSFYLLYEGIVVIALKRPERILFHNLEMQKTELENASEKIKTLKGLLPICASCKKIRDDHGYWDQVENYIMSHSDATFTHGLCPDCMIRFVNEHNSRYHEEAAEKSQFRTNG